MPRPKSFLKTISVDQAIRSHKCKHNASHIVSNGEKRLKLKVARTHEHYCMDCAKEIIMRDIAKLNSIYSSFE